MINNEILFEVNGITKSYKDCRVLRNLGLNSIWLQNEVAIPSRNIFEDLCKRFKRCDYFDFWK